MNREEEFEARLRGELRQAADGARSGLRWEQVLVPMKTRRRRRRVLRATIAVAAAVGVILAGVRVSERLGREDPRVVIVGDAGAAVTIPSSRFVYDAPEDTLPPGEVWGLWAGNVDVLPAHTTRLPAEFYQRPAAAETIHLPANARDSLFASPDGIPKPLWVFFGEVTVDQVRVQVVAAKAAGRPVFLVGAADDVVKQLLGAPSPGSSSTSTPGWSRARAIAFWTPREPREVRQGVILPASEASSAPTGQETYASLAIGSVYAGERVVSAEEQLQRMLDSGQFYGFWSGNVETIPARPAHLPDFFFAGPTPTTQVRVVGGVAVRVDSSTIKRPLWVFGNEVDVESVADRIRKAKADGRVVVFCATPIAVIDRIMGLPNTGGFGAGTPLELQWYAWLPWLNSGGSATMSLPTGTTTADAGGTVEEGAASPDATMIFEMMAEQTLMAPPR
jgi:hypothetical protein